MSTPHVYQSISNVTAIMAGEGLSKARTNQQQNYKFRGIDDVYNALSRHLANEKLCILPRVLERVVAERPTKSGGVSTYVVLDVEFDLVSAIDGSKHTIRTMGEAMDTADKATNKAMSAAMKYACIMAFQIPTEGDNDSDAHHHEPADLTRQLSASIDWEAWESKQISRLRTSAKKSMGQLQEVWSEVYTDAKSAPDSVRDRLKAEKDALKQEARGSVASAP